MIPAEPAGTGAELLGERPSTGSGHEAAPTGSGHELPSTGSGHETFDRMWHAIAPIGRTSTGGYRRLAWTVEDALLREWFASECADRGLDLTEDRMGNQWAWWGDPEAAGKGVVAGSHLDSVPDGGAFDGPLGVISALAAIDALRAQDFHPTRPIGVVHFGDEEGARFGVACAGSRVITGALPAERALALTDADGISLAEAMRGTGRDPDAIGSDPRTLSRVGTFVELHVEQGRGLADLREPVAIGTQIWPHGRWRLDFPGEPNHAGTTPIADRRDAMIGLAEAVLAARRSALQRGTVATVGKTLVRPGAVNAIPSAATGWLDVRGPDEDAVRRTVAETAEVAAGFGATLIEESWTRATEFAPDLIARLATVLGDPPLLGTGAGHDAGILSAAGTPAMMIFVRNPTGVSHSPAEHAERDDCLTGVTALATVLAELAG